MVTNLDRFRSDLSALVKTGDLLELSAQRYCNQESFDESLMKAYKDDKSKFDEAIKKMPKFQTAYESWYSESLRVITQLIPERILDFRSQYDVPKTRKNIDPGNYTVHDMLQGLRSNFGNFDTNSGIPRLRMQINILKSAERRFESSLFEMRQLVQADLFDSELGSAQELLKNNFVRAAGAVAGVVLEKHLKQVCDDHSVKINKAKPTLSVLNDALKDALIIDIPQWRFNQHLGDIRNNCDHARQPEPSDSQVKDLIDGTAKVIKTIS